MRRPMADCRVMVAVVALAAPLAAQPNQSQPAAAPAPAEKAPAAKAPAAEAPAGQKPAGQKPAGQATAPAPGAGAGAGTADAGGDKAAEAPAGAGASAAPAAAESDPASAAAGTAVPEYTPVTATTPAAAPAPQRPPPAEPEARRREPAEFPAAAYLNVEQLWNTDPGYDLFDEDNVGGQLGVGLSYDLLTVAPDTALVAELAYSAESHEAGYLYGGAIQSTKLSGHNLLLAGSVHHRMLPWIGPHARLAVGLSSLKAELQEEGQDQYRDTAKFSLPFVRLGAGVSVEQTLGQLLALGLLVEGGYALGSAFEVELEPVSEQGEIPTEYANLGKLSRSGPYLRTALVARF